MTFQATKTLASASGEFSGGDTPPHAVPLGEHRHGEQRMSMMIVYFLIVPELYRIRGNLSTWYDRPFLCFYF
jgi:hypothetical protein